MSLELSAFVYALKYFRYILLGTHFVAYIDNKSIVTLKSAPDKHGKFSRMLNFLGQYSFTLKHVVTDQNLADILTRNINNPEISEKELEQEMPQDMDLIYFLQSKHDLSRLQREDQTYGPIIQAIENPDSVANPKVLKKTKFFVLKQGKLFHISMQKSRSNRGERTKVYQLCVPEVLKNEWFHSVHSGTNSAHLGFSKTLAKVTKRYYFSDLRQYLAHRIRSCPTCQKTKVPQGMSHGELQHNPPGRLFETFQIDSSGPYAVTERNNRYLMTAVDEASRFTISRPVKDLTALTVANFIFEEIYCKYGAPRTLKTDMHASFRSKVYTELCKLLGIDASYALAYSHTAIGAVEISHRILETMIKKRITEGEEKNWDRYIFPVVHALNTSNREGLKFSSFFLLYGLHAREVTEQLFSYPFETEIVRLDQHMIRHARDLAKESLQKEHDRVKKYYDRKHKQVRFEPGSKVLIYDPAYNKSASKVWAGVYRGPGVIVARIHANEYQVKTQNKHGKDIVQRIATSRLKPYFDSEEENQIYGPIQVC
jgi:hypothetical protein